MWSFFFFFQAEDGIRDAQESRGLGDVYKRQVKHLLNYPDGLGIYSSMTAYVLAIGINVFGLALNALAAAGRFDAGAGESAR